MCFRRLLSVCRSVSCTEIVFHKRITIRTGRSFHKSIVEGNSDNLTLTQMKNTLESNSFKFDDGFACLLTSCINCGDKNGSLYINKITGFYMCMECHRCGSWDDFKGQLISPKKKTGKSGVSQVVGKKNTLMDSVVAQDGHKKWLLVTKLANEYSTLSETERNTMKVSFNLNEVPEHLMEELHVHIDSEYLYFPLKNVEKHIVGYKQLATTGDEFSVPHKQCPGILKYIPKKVKRKADQVIITHSVKDLIALSLLATPYHIICLPHGVTTLPQEVLPILEQYKKIIIWFGNDAVALNSVPSIVRKLGEQRCFFVRATDTNPAAHIAFRNGMKLESIINAASPVLHPSVTTFSTFRQDILSELQNIDKTHGVKWNRFPKLNEILRGHRRGELTILTGPTGCGKTTFISEYSLDLALQGVPTLWGSFEIRNQRLARTMLQQMVFLPLEQHLNNFDIWADQFQQLPIYFMTFHGPQSVNVVMEAVKHATYVHDIGHVVIDNLQFMMGLAGGDNVHLDRFYKQDVIIAYFRNFATKYNCHVTLIIHPRKEKEEDELTSTSIFGSAKASQEADNILIIQKKQLQSLQFKKYLQVTKNRYTGDLGVMPLIFEKNGLSFAQKKKPDKDDQMKPTDKNSISSDKSVQSDKDSLMQSIDNESILLPDQRASEEDDQMKSSDLKIVPSYKSVQCNS